MVGIVIVHYTGREDTLECLASVFASADATDSRVYLVDQGVGDRTPDAVRDHFPSVNVIENGTNLGYAGGANVGIRAALTEGAEHVLLLNNDVTLAPEMLDWLLNASKSAPDVGILGPVLLVADGTDRVWAAGGRIDWRGQASRLEQEQSEPDYLIGCGMLVRRDVFERIGMFDERFFLYYEEADLCARAKAAGFSLRCVPQALLWHKVSHATGTDSPLTLYYMRRNMLLYLAKRRQWLGWLVAVSDTLRLAMVWNLQQKKNHTHRKALHSALCDALRARWGKAENRW